jgi:iron(III) transport system ATP-binding protein
LEPVDSGVIKIAGRTVNDPERGVTVPPEKRQLGMVFQSYAIWPHMTVFENVAYPLRIRGMAQGAVRERVANALRLVEMEEFASRPAPMLSGGQQQRVAIARAIVAEPEVLLLDEPLSNLDARLRLQMGEEFRRLQQRLGITTLYVTHDQDEAMALSDRVVVMQSGRVLQIGAPQEIYDAPQSAQVAGFFGSPNFLPASVTWCEPLDDGGFAVSVEGAQWQGACRSFEPFALCEKVLVLLRPEALRFTTTDEARRVNVWQGTVKRSTFRGASRFFEIDAQDGVTLRVEVTGSSEPVVGPVAVTTDAHRLWAVRAA